jgi:hypothetical protein
MPSRAGSYQGVASATPSPKTNRKPLQGLSCSAAQSVFKEMKGPEQQPSSPAHAAQNAPVRRGTRAVGLDDQILKCLQRAF